MFVSIMKGPIVGPYIYFILNNEMVYIGETQRHPSVRWGEHISSNGTLAKKMYDYDFEMSDLNFIAICCFDFIPALDKNYSLKFFTQAIEHSLHCLVSAQPSLLGGFRRVISSTEKTAPRRFNDWVAAEAISMTILNEVRQYL